MNIFNKESRVILPKQEAGKQLAQKPTFAKSNQRFTTSKTIRSVSIVIGRSSNKYAVNTQKRSGFAKQGLKSSSSPEIIDNIQLAYSFQSNFIFSLVS